MKKIFVSLFTVLLVSILGTSTAFASPPIEASGTLTYTSSTFNNIRTVGGNTIIDLSATVIYTGTFTGTSTLHGILIFHPDGSVNFHDVETFTGTVNGMPGTVTFELDGTADAELNVTATAIIMNGTGQLANLHGVLRESAVVLDKMVGPVGTYIGQIYFGNE